MKNIVSENIDEQASAEALGNLARDADHLNQWRNYHLIGDVIRGDVQTTGNCLVSKIEDALAKEPTLLAPVPVKESETRGIDIWKASGMFAVAASVALFAVIGLTPGLSPVSNEGGVIAQTSDHVVSPLLPTPSTQDEFGQMLVEHGEFTATTGMNGLLSYAKLVSNQPLKQ